MNEDKESLLESFQDGSPEAAAEPKSGEEVPFEEDMSAVAEALLNADALAGDASLPDVPSPDENSNPALAVEEMLSMAVLDEVAELGAGEGPAESGSAPTFQLKIGIEKAASRDEIKKIAAEMELTLPEATWASETPMVSQLSEFQALYFLQRLRALGLAATVEALRPGHALSEDELALGSLSEVPEASPIKTEGAPSVVLPGNEKSVLLYSGDSLPAFPVSQTLGIVTAHRSLARRFFRDEEISEKLKKEMERVPGRGASNLPKSRLEGLFRELFLDLQKAALSLGGNAVLGVKIDTFPETNSLDPSLEQMRLVAFGTAAVVEKWDP